MPRFLKVDGPAGEFWINPELVVVVSIPTANGIPVIGTTLVNVLGVGPLVFPHSPEETLEILTRPEDRVIRLVH